VKINSISEKLILYFVGFGIFVIIVIGAYSYQTTKKALLDRTFEQLTSLRLEKKNQIEQLFLDRERDINLIAQSDETRKLIDFIHTNQNQEVINGKLPFNSYLINFISSLEYAHRLFIADKNDSIIEVISIQSDIKSKHVINVISDAVLKDFCRELRLQKKSIIKDLSGPNFSIQLGAPIIDEGNNCIGSIVLEMPIAAINKIMVGYSPNDAFSKTIESYLVGDDSLMRSNSRFNEDAVYRTKVTSASVKKALKGETGFLIVKDYRNISCLSSYSKVNIKGLNWVLLAELDEQEALVPVYSIRNSIILISLIVAASVFIFTYLISRKITLPLKRLEKASSQIGAGNYEVNLEVSSFDEIGLLTATFNKMASQLKKQSEELEEEKKKRVRSLIDGQEMERQRLSRDLHDSLGQSILAVKMKLEQINDEKIEGNNRVVFETRELLKNAIHEIRVISNDLMPHVLEAFGIETGLKKLCKETSENTGMIIHFSSENLPESLGKKIQIYLYRITQEIINNIIKHSEAKEVRIKISANQDFVFLKINDNGKGFEMQKNNVNGNGINNIQERVELLNGSCEINSNVGKGTEISIKLPIVDL
jgi:signal transduction histidine kinase